MTTVRSRPSYLGNVGGFTLMEMLFSMVLASLLLGSTVSVFVSQSRHFNRQREMTDARETLRGAAALLAYELRHVSAERGDLSELQPQSVTIRSFVGTGDVCGIHSSKERYALWEPVGDFVKLDKDSAIVYNGAAGWVALQYKNVWENPALTDVPVCEWPGTFVPELVVEVDKVGSGAGHVGSTVWHFRSVDYGMIEKDGRWWLAQRVSSNKDNKWELLTGPLRSPSQRGLWFRYFDGTGTETADPAQVQRVEVTLRAESQGSVVQRDSVSITVRLRN